MTEDAIRNGDNRFWYAQGTVVDEFLDKLWELAIAPIDETKNKQLDFRGRTEKQEQLYLFLPDKKSLEQLGELTGPPEVFFRYAEGAYIGDLIDEVRITVRHKGSRGAIGFDHLSEGELQLLTVLGLMRITSQDHCLFLLDEPDTHLNPIWKLRYFDEIEKVIQADKDGTLCSTYENQYEESETAYLLDPTDPEDVNLIAFDDEGNVIPAPYNDMSDWQKQRVEESIERLKLNRHEALTEARKKVWQTINREIGQSVLTKCRVNNIRTWFVVR